MSRDDGHQNRKLIRELREELGKTRTRENELLRERVDLRRERDQIRDELRSVNDEWDAKWDKHCRARHANEDKLRTLLREALTLLDPTKPWFNGPTPTIKDKITVFKKAKALGVTIGDNEND